MSGIVPPQPAEVNAREESFAPPLWIWGPRALREAINRPSVREYLAPTDGYVALVPM